MDHPLKGRKQSPEHIAKRMASLGDFRPSGGGRKKNTPEVLWSKVDIRDPDECWPWKGFRNEQGYGRTWIDDKGYYAHRVIFDLQNPGLISLEAPKDRTATGWVRHSCDNPPCCNPKHLLLGTHADNMRDKVERGRSKWFDLSIESPRAKLTAEDVRQIRKQRALGVRRKILADRYGVSESTIKGVISGRHYGDI
jgi:hypothetical protein